MSYTLELIYIMRVSRLGSDCMLFVDITELSAVGAA